MWGALTGLVARLALPAALSLAVAGALTSGWLLSRLERAEARVSEAQADTVEMIRRNELLEAEIAARRAAAEVYRAHRLRLERDAAERADLIRELTEGEGADAPLSDYLRGAAERLWP